MSPRAGALRADPRRDRAAPRSLGARRVGSGARIALAERAPCATPSRAIDPAPPSGRPMRARALLARRPSLWHVYLDLCKPRIVSLVVFTALVAMALAVPPGPLPWGRMVAGVLGIALAAAAAAALNHVADRDIDARMARTRLRPLPREALPVGHAVGFALGLAGAAALVLWLGTNGLTALLALATLVGYAVVYTRWLKRLTPQNIVLGGASGAFPAILGWTAVADEIAPPALALFLIVFVWTPAHFWPLAIARRDEYAAAGIPMLPVTHGVDFTRRRILAYALGLVPVSLTPWVAGASGAPYALGAVLLGAVYVRRAWVFLRRGEERGGDRRAMALFRWSIVYLFALFALMLADRWVGAGW